MTEKQNQLANKPKTLEEHLYSDKFQQSLMQVAANSIEPQRFCKLALVAFSKNAKLKACSQQSIFKSLMDAAELGLDPSGTLGKAYLVPYGADAQLIVGYRGLIELAQRNGKIKSIKAVAVYENDTFEINELAEPPITHKPLIKGDRGDFILAYAYARFTDGVLQYDWMSKQEIDSIRNRSKAAKSGPWVTDYMEMAKKTVIRRLCKVLPLEVDVLSIEGKDFDTIEMDSNVNQNEIKLGSEALADKIKKKVESKQVEPEQDNMESSSDPADPIIPPGDLEPYSEEPDYPNKVLPEERYYCQKCQIYFKDNKCPNCYSVKTLDRWETK